MKLSSILISSFVFWSVSCADRRSSESTFSFDVEEGMVEVTVKDPTGQLQDREAYAKQIAQKAVASRKQLSREWMNVDLPDFRGKMPISVEITPTEANGGATSFMFDSGPFNENMQIQGSPVGVMDAVLPHEIMHTVNAAYHKRPLPRWLDEGTCTMVENDIEKKKIQQKLREFMGQHRLIPIDQLLPMNDYPDDVLPLYAQGYMLSSYLVDKKSKKDFVDFTSDVLAQNPNSFPLTSWLSALQKHYGYSNLEQLDQDWKNWFLKGMPPSQVGGSAAPSGGQNPKSDLVVYLGNENLPGNLILVASKVQIPLSFCLSDDSGLCFETFKSLEFSSKQGGYYVYKGITSEILSKGDQVLFGSSDQSQSRLVKLR